MKHATLILASLLVVAGCGSEETDSKTAAQVAALTSLRGVPERIVDEPEVAEEIRKSA